MSHGLGWSRADVSGTGLAAIRAAPYLMLTWARVIRAAAPGAFALPHVKRRKKDFDEGRYQGSRDPRHHRHP